MAVVDEAGAAPRFDEVARLADGLASACIEVGGARGLEDRLVGGELVDVDIEQALELRPREILGPAFRRLVKIDDRFGHSRDLGRGQLARARQTVEQRFLIKASHLDQPIDHRALTIAHALAIDRQRAVGSASHRHRTTLEGSARCAG